MNEQGEKMKRVISLLLMTAMLISLSIFPTNAQSIMNVDTSDHSAKEFVELFITSYESVGEKNSRVDFNIGSYFSDESSLDAELLDLLVDRRVMLNSSAVIGEVLELDKELSFDYKIVDVGKNSASIEVKVTKYFSYSHSPDVKSGAADTYTFELIKDKGWQIKSLDGFADMFVRCEFEEKGYSLESVEDVKSYHLELANDIETSNAELLKELDEQFNVSIDKYAIPTTKSTSINRSGARNYARLYAMTPNSAYYYFPYNSSTNTGGDCTNFISQCLHEGGDLPTEGSSQYSTTDWFYNTSSDRSAAWTGAKQFQEYCDDVNHFNWSSTSSFVYLNWGDIVQLLKSDGTAKHSLIITDLVHDGIMVVDVLYCCHTADRLDYSLVVNVVNKGYSREYKRIFGTN